MASTITNFLVGIGLDTSDFEKGEKQVVSGIDSLRSKALQLGAIAGGAFGVNKLTFGFAKSADELGKFAEVFGVIPDDIRAIGNALEQEGGTLDSFLTQIEGIQRLRASTPQQIGALFAEAGVRGVDPSVILNAKSATDAYLELANVIASLPAEQRLPVADVFGLDEASIRLLSQGRSEVEQLIERQREIRPLTDEMTEAAAEFNREWKDLQNNLGAVADTVSNELVPVFTGLFATGNEFFQLLREDASLPSIASETGQGGRLSAVAAFGEGAAFLDKPINESIKEITEDAPFIKALIPSFLQYSFDDFKSLFSSDTGPQLREDDPNMARAVSDMLSNRRTDKPIQVQLLLDGQVLDERIINVNEQQDNIALEDLRSTTGG